MRPHWGKKTFLSKISNHWTARSPSDVICYSLCKRGNKSSSLTICDALAMRWTTTQPALRIERRHCVKYLREAISQAHSRMWRNPQSVDEDTTLLPLTCFLWVSPCLSPLIVFWVSRTISCYHAEVCVQTKISLIFPWTFPAWLPRICLWSEHNAQSCCKCTHTQRWVGRGSPISSQCYVEHLSQISQRTFCLKL